MNTIAYKNLFQDSISNHIVTKKIDINSKLTGKLFISICIGILFFLGVYLWEINSMAGIGYQMKELESQVNSLKTTNQELTLKITQAKSSQNILSKLEELNMVPVAKVNYISTTSSDVALVK